MNCCNVCRKNYSTKQSLKRHQKTTKIHKNKSISCIQSYFRTVNSQKVVKSPHLVVSEQGLYLPTEILCEIGEYIPEIFVQLNHEFSQEFKEKSFVKIQHIREKGYFQLHLALLFEELKFAIIDYPFFIDDYDEEIECFVESYGINIIPYSDRDKVDRLIDIECDNEMFFFEVHQKSWFNKCVEELYKKTLKIVHLCINSIIYSSSGPDIASLISNTELEFSGSCGFNTKSNVSEPLQAYEESRFNEYVKKYHKNN